MRLLIGVDVGTSGCKVVAITAEGAVVGSHTQTYPTRYPCPGWAELDPDDWYRAACAALRGLVQATGLDGRDVAAISIDGPAHNVALLDEDGRTLYPTIHWSDLRSVPQAEWLQARHGDEIFATTYQRVNPSWTLAQLLWLKEHEPLVWSRLRRILVTKDYVRYRFTGAYETDVYDAIGTQLYDVRADRWSPTLCRLLEFPTVWLPPVRSATALAGELQPAAAGDAGLPPGIPVAVGSGDSVVEAFGVGAVEPGQGLVKLATAANVDLVTARPHPSAKTLTYRHIVGDRWFTITATNSGAATMHWFRESFCRHEAALAAARGADAYDLIGDLAAGAPAGCEGLLFHPYLMGERSPHWDPRLRGDFVGISARHGLNHFARAVLEGVAFSLRDCLALVEELGEPLVDLRLIGGGARSPLWRRILCDVLGRPLIRPSVEDASLGAALLAGVATGVFTDWRGAAAVGAAVVETLQPDPGAHRFYGDYFDVYQAVTRDLAVHQHRLADLAAQTVEQAQEGVIA